jgi:hypothetical protein
MTAVEREAAQVRVSRVLDSVKARVDAHDWEPADVLLAFLHEVSPHPLAVSYRALITMLAGWDKAGWLPSDVLRDAAWSTETEMRTALAERLYGEPF